MVCEAVLPSDAHVPLCDKPNRSKCNTVHYFDQNQCPQVPGDNWYVSVHMFFEEAVSLKLNIQN